MSSCPRIVWEHQTPERTNMGKFRAWLEKESGRRFKGFEQLHDFSTQNRAVFWDLCWKYFQLIHEGAYSVVVDEMAPIQSVPSWFPGVRINYSENMLFSRQGKHIKEDSKVAVVEIREGRSADAQHWTWAQLRQKVGQLSQALRAYGITKGDRIAGCSGNHVDMLTLFLATTLLGAIFCPSATDMGVEGLLDRLAQVKPRLIFMDESTFYNGKEIDLREKIKHIATAMADVDGFERIILLSPYSVQHGKTIHTSKTETLSTFLARAPGSELKFERVEFGHPAMIAFSSGTTGQPKCIVHSVGGLLLNAHKESGLHLECKPESINLQYTTTGWIMYLFAIQPLLFGSTVILYDGSPLAPTATALLQIVSDHRVTHLGISPRYLSELRSRQIVPCSLWKLDHLQVVTSTGMILSDDLFEWFYDTFPPHVQLCNISGGTEIAGCLTISNSLSPVYVGGCSGKSLGIAIAVYGEEIHKNPVSSGAAVEDGSPGELVVTEAFPNMPVGFWGPNGRQRYLKAHFSRFPNVWNHGDNVVIHPVTKQVMFLGRADGVLNPSGVRFGSAEIYRIIDRHFGHEVADSLCVGQKRPQDKDERVMLFLLMSPGFRFSHSLVERVKSTIRVTLSPRHVPAFIFKTPDIPMTINMKKVELPVKHIVSGKTVEPPATLKNPGSLKYYYQFSRVEELTPKKARL